MAIPNFTIRQLMEAGVHFGHNPRRWNPKMASYLYGVRNNVHIIDLGQTAPMLYEAMQVVHQIVLKGGRVLFVGTKPQASDVMAEAASRCGQYYVNHRWLGGMMTNWKTVSKSINRLKDFENTLDNPTGLTKKERLQLTREKEKLERAIGGIREMGGVPNVLVVIDTNKEQTAVKEAKKLGIPVVGIVDSNSDPDEIDYPVPGNDDAIRSIRMYCDLFAGTILDALQEQLAAAGVDLGASETLPDEEEFARPRKVEKKAEKEKVEEEAKAEINASKAENEAAQSSESDDPTEDTDEEKKPVVKKTVAKTKVETSAKKSDTKTAEKKTTTKSVAKKAPAKKVTTKSSKAKSEDQ